EEVSNSAITGHERGLQQLYWLEAECRFIYIGRKFVYHRRCVCKRMWVNFLKMFSFMLMMVVCVFALALCVSNDVEITLPASFFEGKDIDEMITEAKEEEGVKEVTKNDDGSITYKLTKERHKEMMDEMKKEIDTSIEEMKSGDDFASIKD